MAMLTYQVLICNDDKFALSNGHLYYHQANLLPKTAVLVSEAIVSASAIYAITKLESERLGWTLPTAVVFVSFRQIITNCSQQTANQLTKAMQLLRFRADHLFCSRCGTATMPHPLDNATVCPNCHYHQYPRIQPCIITAIVKHVEGRPHLLLAHHHRAKDSGMYALIAGFVEVGESLESCVQREVAEEVGLEVTNLRYFASQPWAYPSNLMVGFLCDYASGDIILDDAELIDAKFFAIDDLQKADAPPTPPKGTIAHALIEQVKAIDDAGNPP